MIPQENKLRMWLLRRGSRGALYKFLQRDDGVEGKKGWLCANEGDFRGRTSSYYTLFGSFKLSNYT